MKRTRGEKAEHLVFDQIQGVPLTFFLSDLYLPTMVRGVNRHKKAHLAFTAEKETLISHEHSPTEFDTPAAIIYTL